MRQNLGRYKMNINTINNQKYELQQLRLQESKVFDCDYQFDLIKKKEAKDKEEKKTLRQVK